MASRLVLSRGEGPGPPKDVHPAKLFRIVTRRPRPVLAIRYRLDFYPYELYARGLLGREDVAVLYDERADAPHEDVRMDRVAVALVAATLCDVSGHRLLRVEQAVQLHEHELYDLATTLAVALATCSPAMWRSNIDEWKAVLKKGAQHPTNVADMATMAGAGGGTARRWRPDLYYGCAFHDLTDGQILAYDAAVDAYCDRAPKPPPRPPHGLRKRRR